MLTFHKIQYILSKCCENKEKILWEILFVLSIFELLYTFNYIIFIIWQSAFTHANIPLLEYILNIALCIAILLILVVYYTFKKTQRWKWLIPFWICFLCIVPIFEIMKYPIFIVFDLLTAIFLFNLRQCMGFNKFRSKLGGI